MVVKIRINRKSISTKIQKLEEQGERLVKSKLTDIAEDLSARVLVDTGAYAESFSVVPSSFSGGRSRSRNGRARDQDLGTFQGVALSNMTSDIRALELKDERSVKFVNRAPHAGEVEDKHQIFQSMKDRFR